MPAKVTPKKTNAPTAAERAGVWKTLTALIALLLLPFMFKGMAGVQADLATDKYNTAYWVQRAAVAEALEDLEILTPYPGNPLTAAARQDLKWVDYFTKRRDQVAEADAALRQLTPPPGAEEVHEATLAYFAAIEGYLDPWAELLFAVPDAVEAEAALASRQTYATEQALRMEAAVAAVGMKP